MITKELLKKNSIDFVVLQNGNICVDVDNMTLEQWDVVKQALLEEQVRLAEQYPKDENPIDLMDKIALELDKKRTSSNTIIVLHLSDSQINFIEKRFVWLRMSRELRTLKDYGIVKRLGYEFMIYAKD